MADGCLEALIRVVLSLESDLRGRPATEKA